MALHHAHEKRDREGRALKVVHRDVTPHNIIISLDAVVKVLDFGVAQTAARVDTEAGAVRGTYAYMGPEQVRGKPLDKRADVFALGVILWELTTARRLFRGSDIEIMTSIVERDVPPPSRHVPNYPAELEHIVLHALQRDRGKRTASAAHLAVALDLFCMRHGVASGALVVSQYVRSLYPYERAHEKGMGIARESGTHTEDGTGRKPRDPRAAVASPEDLEAKLVAAELRALGHSNAKAAVLREAAPESELLELTAEDLVADDDEADAADGADGADGQAKSAKARTPDRLGLDAFDDDSDVRPVVLLSSKRKGSAERADGAFMSDLERRLAQEPPASAVQPSATEAQVEPPPGQGQRGSGGPAAI
jgi:hypothetical protein